jgi:flagellar biosynthesis protein FliR
MPGEVTLSAGVLLGFLLVLARVAGAFVFVPLPGLRAAPEPARVVLSLGCTLALFPRWPVMDAGALSAGRLVGWVLAEALIGVAMGLAVAVVLEAFVMAAQVLGLQAGYAYASTIDPTTQADSGILLVLAQLMAGMLFFAIGLDRELIRLLARSLDQAPPGAWLFTAASGEIMIRLAANVFTLGLRLALPVVGLLVLVDVALALLGRLNQQLQLLSLAFPVKMLLALAMLSWGAALFPRLLRAGANDAWRAFERLLGS